MAGLNDTPSANRIHIAFFGLRNAGKSTLVNEFTGQSIAIVSATPGTTTDPVSKAMEILPLGPCLITDTAGLDDVGELGAQRVEKTLAVLATTDIAVWVGEGFAAWQPRFHVPVVQYRRGESVDALKAKITAIQLQKQTPDLLAGIVTAGDKIICVVPIDDSAPKGRLILPQQQVIRECLDRHATCVVCQPGELLPVLVGTNLVITDSQSFKAVRDTLNAANAKIGLTSFSILFARQKGDLAEYARGIDAIRRLHDGDTVLIAEGCTHHRQCNDIGTVKIPQALTKLSGRQLKFEFASGGDFLKPGASPKLVVQCGGCMLTRREVLRRIAVCRDAGLPIINYGMLLAAVNGMVTSGNSVLVK